MREAEPGGVDGLIDAAVMAGAVLPAVRDGGVIAALRAFDGEPDRGIRVYQVSPKDYLGQGEALREIVELADRGVLTIRVARSMPAADASEAHREFEAGGVRGRLVLTL